MGVRGLQRFLSQNRASCVDTVDLIAKAARAKSLRQKAVEIIVDFSAMRVDLYRKITRALAQSPYSNPYLTLPVGDYHLIYIILRHYLEQLRTAGLQLTFVFDSLKISNREEQDSNYCLKGWERTRNEERMMNMERVMNMLKDPPDNFQKDGHVPLPWFGRLLGEVITEMEFECLHAPLGQDSDFFRAKLQRQRKAFAVLTNDMNCLLFPDCPIILWRMFDEENHLSYDPKSPTVAPEKLLCGRIVSSKIWKHLQLSNHDQWIDLTSVLGNLFTKPYANVGPFLYYLRVANETKSRCSESEFQAIAHFIRCQGWYTHIEFCPEVQKKIQDKSTWRKACVEAREYFNLRSDPLKVNLSKLEDDRILAFQGKNMLRMGNCMSRFYCKTSRPFGVLEDLRLISHQEALMKLRCHLLAFVHKKEDDARMNVYFRVRNSVAVSSSLVQPVYTGSGSTVEDIMEDNEDENMRRFVEVMNCYRDTKQPDRVSDMLNSRDFMRVFLVLCWRLAQNVEPERGYFADGGHLLALTTSMLTLWDPEMRQEVLPLLEQLYSMSIVPEPCEVTLFNWMQCICLDARDLTLFLRLDRFLDPHLSTMFSFSLFLAYVHIQDFKIWNEPNNLRASLETLQQKVHLNYSSLLELVPVSGVDTVTMQSAA